MSFIEKTLPVKHLNRVAMSEGNAKKPVYQMHKWWARRLGSVFRMLTLAAFSPDHESEENLWRRFCDGADLDGKIVLDPFMGGGTTIVEALRLGCKVIGLDINPVAWFITKKEVEPVNLEALDAAFEQLQRTAGDFIKQYYWTRCAKGHDADVMYFFWVKVAECTACGSRVSLFPNYELSRRGHFNVCFCPRCLEVIETLGYDPKTGCPACGEVFDPRKGISARGIFQCPACGIKQKVLDAVVRKSSPLDIKLHALEYYCETCGRGFKRADEEDMVLWRKAKSKFWSNKDQLLIPHQAIPAEGRSDPRPINHGYTHFWQMFNERQLLCLSKLLQEIIKLPDRNIRELMLVAFSDCLDANNMFCKYEIQWHKISLFFGLHAYHPIERPTENNVWGTKFGRSTFVKCFEKVRRAKAYCQKPYERLLDVHGERFSNRTANERIEGVLVDSFEALSQLERAVLLRCHTSEDLSLIPSKSVDAVITDPPYFDNVMYSELADFFYVWLRLALKHVYAWFEPELSSRPNEIVKNDKLGKTMDFFNKGLASVFKECHRVLKDEGLMIFTFHHNKRWAWESLAQTILDAGFYISATPIVRSEGKSGFHSSEGNIRYDPCIVCRKQPSDWKTHDWVSLKDHIISDATAWTRRTLESGMTLNEVDIFTIVMAKTVEFYTKATPVVIDGSEFPSISDAIREMNDLVSRIIQTVKSQTIDPKRAYPENYIQLSLALADERVEFRRSEKSGIHTGTRIVDQP